MSQLLDGELAAHQLKFVQSLRMLRENDLLHFKLGDESLVLGSVKQQGSVVIVELVDELASEVLRAYRAGMSQRGIAQRLGINRYKVNLILDEWFVGAKQEVPTLREVAAYRCGGCGREVIYQPCLICLSKGESPSSSNEN